MSEYRERCSFLNKKEEMMGVAERIAHACDLTVLSCIDFRLQARGGLFRALQRELALKSNSRWPGYLRAVGIGCPDFDLVTVPGACHRLVRETDADRNVLLRDLGKSVALHQPERLVIIQHENCGMYHSHMTFRNWEEERRVMSADIAKAVPTLRAQFPQLTIHGFIARLSTKTRLTGKQYVTQLDRVDLSTAMSGVNARQAVAA